jgi:hypothetical protein
MTDNEAYVRIGEFIESHQSDTYSQIGRKLGLSRHQVSRIARLRGMKREPGKRSAALQSAVALIDAAMAQPDSVSADAPANPLMEENISIAPDAPSVEETLSPEPETPSAEIAVA